MRIRTLAASLTLGFSALAGCRSGETLDSPAVVDPSFTRYVAMGNSITAGFQSVGINDSTQQRAYPMLLAAAMGTGFAYPSLNMPGCPAPFVNNVTQVRVGGAASTDCALRGPTPMWLNNLGVPGNAVGTLLSNFGGLPSDYAPLRLFLLGGYTEVQMMQKIQPTFTTIWIGNNDVLGAETSLSDVGDTSLITPVAQFDAQYDSVASAVAATGSKAVLISVGNVDGPSLRLAGRDLLLPEERRLPRAAAAAESDPGRPSDVHRRCQLQSSCGRNEHPRAVAHRPGQGGQRRSRSADRPRLHQPGAGDQPGGDRRDGHGHHGLQCPYPVGSGG